MTLPPIVLTGVSLLLEDLVDVSNGTRSAVLSGAALGCVEDARAIVDGIARSNRVAYGITTGFGALADVRIDGEKLRKLQLNLVRSHAAGVGDPIPSQWVRAVMLLRANCLARGVSGVRTITLARLLELLAHGIHPLVPAQGSVGASGDLAPLSHVALAVIGEGEVEMGGERMPTAAALARAGLEPIVLEAKEGLSLVNGTQFTTAIGALALSRLLYLLKAADLVAALSVDALNGTDQAFDERIHRSRPHPGQLTSAANIRRALDGSSLCARRRRGGRVQDAYALRCTPQVHGTAREAAGFARRVIETEMNSAADNPLVFPSDDGEGVVLSGGNFHAAPVALVCDLLTAAVADLTSLSERRIERLVNPALSSGLPQFLVNDGGINSGFMILHVTAAALVSEAKAMSFPASVDSIPTSAGQEDHVSMGPIAARKLAKNVESLERVLAIELLSACQGLDFRRPLRSSDKLESVHRRLREKVPFWDEDRIAAPDVERARSVLLWDLDDELADLA